LQCASIVSLNRAIASAPEEDNSQPFTLKSCSRRQYFEEVEKQALSLLNPLRYPMKKQVMATVMKDSHIRPREDMHCYSVPYTQIGKKVKILYSLEKVEIYDGYRLIAVHSRCRTPFQPTTDVSHLHPGHRHILEASPGKFIEAAARIYLRVEGYIKKVLETVRYREQACKFCSGILSLAKKAGNDRLAAACHWTEHIGKYGCHILEEILSKNLDRLDSAVTSVIAICSWNKNPCDSAIICFTSCEPIFTVCPADRW
jgi:hypothetical protein